MRCALVPVRSLLAGLLGLSLLAARAAAGGCCNPWIDLGQGLPGAHGEPLLTGTGSLAGGTSVLISLDGALENSITALIVGLGQGHVPFKGGVLVPTPDLITAPLSTGPAGQVDLGGLWPFGLPPESELVLQWWVADGAGPQGLAASNAMLATTSVLPVPGGFPVDWVHGECSEPQIQVHAYNQSLIMLRQSMCTNFEGPFMYLLFGNERALLIDTGAGGIPIGATVAGLVAQYEADHGLDLDLLVAHTHGHGDHFQGDPQFTGQPNTTVVGVSQPAVAAYFGFQDWPNDIVQLDLGGRVLDVIAIPGHQSAHVAFYDRETGVLQTGDTLYPGFLFIGGAVGQGNFLKYLDSIKRLLDFTEDKPVTWVLGNHIEMTATPGLAYPYGTNFQPNERVIELTRDHLVELYEAVRAMAGAPHVEVHDDFIIQPGG